MSLITPVVLDRQTVVDSDSGRDEKSRGARRQANGIPPLETGDHLSRAEFERRYMAMPRVKKAELVEGVVFMPSPVFFQSHGEPHATVLGWLFGYAAATPGLKLADNTSLRLDFDNEVQPDAMLFRLETMGGQCRIADGDFLEGPPELIVEVAASSASYDMHSKRRVYRRNGVQEYLVLLTLEEEVVWFFLEDGEYNRLVPDDQGVLRSRVFPGLWLHLEHFWNGTLPGLTDTLQQGLASQEHVDFAAKLAQQSP